MGNREYILPMPAWAGLFACEKTLVRHEKGYIRQLFCVYLHEFIAVLSKNALHAVFLGFADSLFRKKSVV